MSDNLKLKLITELINGYYESYGFDDVNTHAGSLEQLVDDILRVALFDEKEVS